MGKLVFIGEDRRKKKKMMVRSVLLLVAALLIGAALLWFIERRSPAPAPVNASPPGKNDGAAPTFLLQPGPTELMAVIAAVNKAELPLDLTKYQKARILWPVYFFKIRQMNGQAALVMFDSNADGFGVSVQGEIDSAEFPEIKRLQPGQKVWLAGRIVAADAAGTGSVRLDVDYCNTDGDTPLDAVVRDMAARGSAR